MPLLDGTERLGVLRITTADDDVRAREDMTLLAALIALILHSKEPNSDALARLTRARPMNIAAEMQWNLTPPRSYADGRVVISASMEPAYTISGDAYDYATADHVVHLAVFDAMGHDTAAGLTANLAVAACRNSRRQGLGLAEVSERTEEVLIEQYGHKRYATGILADLDTRTGLLTWVNRGHHPPVLMRAGRWHSHLDCRPTHPMGTGLGLPTTLCREQLQPGDRIVLYTDGIIEARDAGGQEFGVERFTDFLDRQQAEGLPVPETLRRLMHAVLEHHDGQLQDDATVLFCEWLGPRPRPAGWPRPWPACRPKNPSPRTTTPGAPPMSTGLKVIVQEQDDRLVLLTVAGAPWTTTPPPSCSNRPPPPWAPPPPGPGHVRSHLRDSSGLNTLLRLNRHTRADHTASPWSPSPPSSGDF